MQFNQVIVVGYGLAVAPLRSERYSLSCKVVLHVRDGGVNITAMNPRRKVLQIISLR
jgi:hypothetical protein